MKKTTILLLALFTLVNICNAQNFLQRGNDIDGEAAGDWSGRSVSMPDNNTVAIGALNNHGNGINSGHVRIYRWNGSTWVQKGADIDGEEANDNFGWSVCMSDSNTVAIGAYQNDGSGNENAIGHVRIYRWNGNAWVQKGADINGEAAYDYSGVSVGMPDSNTVAIGAHHNDGNGINSGHVRIFRWNGNAWVQKGADIDGEAADDFSGGSVCMPDSNTVAIGAQQNDANGFNTGHVRIYRWNGSVWLQKGNDLDGEAAYDFSGGSVCMPDSNTVAIGAPNNDANGFNSGHVRIYRWNGNVWLQKGADIDGEASGDGSGWSVSMPDSNTIAVGANQNDGNGSDAGHARIYRWNGNLWVQIGADIDGEATNDLSGCSVSMPDSNTIAVGAMNNAGNGNFAGHTRVYSFKSATNVGVSGNNFGNALKVYPNPTNCELSIDLGSSYNNVSVIISNALGQVVQSQNFSNSNVLQLNIPGEAGVYFIEVNSGDKKARLKVMKK